MSASTTLPAAVPDPGTGPDPTPDPHLTSPGARGAGSGALLLVLAAAGTGVANYVLAVTLVWVLPPAAYAQAVSATALLLVFGSIAGAGIPWLLAREVATTAPRSDARRRSVRFALQLAVLGGGVSGLVVLALVSRYASGATAAAAAVATLGIFLAAVGAGYLQGTARFAALAGYRSVEVGLKVVVGVGAAALGLGALGVVGGAVVGAVACVGIGAVVLARAGDGPSRTGHGRARTGDLVRAAGWICGLQAAVVALTGLDVIVGALAADDVSELAGYQALQVFTKAPLFLATALATAAYPRLAGPGLTAAARRGIEAGTLRTYGWLAGTGAVLVATTPPQVLGLLLPDRYAAEIGLLVPLAVAGLAAGLVLLQVTAGQAARRYARTALVLGAAAVVGVPAVVLTAHRPTALAWTAAAGLTALVVALARTAPRGAAVPAPGTLAAGGLLVLAAAATRGVPLAWVVVAAGGAAVAVTAVRSPARAPGPLRVLHLAFEDPAAPHAGGGSRRTHEVCSRLAAAGVEVTVLSTGFPGCRTEVRDGVTYAHAGWALGRWTGHPFGAQLSYFAAVVTSTAFRAHRLRADVVVEDFAAPFSSVAVPWLTGRPVVGVVQWLFAPQKAAQYHLPVDLVERVGLASHRTLVAVSEDLAAQLRTRNPRARVVALPNGLETARTAAPVDHLPRPHRRDALFLGRLEVAQKGVDTLVAAYALVAPRTAADLHLAGDGPDRERLEAQAAAAGVADRVHFLGRVDGAARFDLLAQARLVVMPSRYETFGMVAAEALAVGTPVLATAVPCLGELVPPQVGVRVPPDDVPALAEALLALLEDPDRCRALGAAGPASVAHLDWDRIAAEQLAVYRSVVGDVPGDDVTGDVPGAAAGAR